MYRWKIGFLMVLSTVLISSVGLASFSCAAEADENAPGLINEGSGDTETVYQVALLQSLAQGYYDGIISVGQLKEHGDTGIGTFEGVNGEMIVLDGVVYQAVSDCTIEIPSDDEMVPFSNVTFFDEDEQLLLSDVSDMASLQDRLNEYVKESGANLFYFVKVKGDFRSLKVRSEYKQEKPYRELAAALAEDQVECDLEQISGTMVGLYCPDYMNGLNSVGWHFHFISDDLAIGGHVLQVSIENAEALIDVTAGFTMELPEEEAFQQVDLSRDMKEAIQRVETAVTSE